MERIFVDSDVILDLLLDREPFAEASGKILTMAIEGKVQGYVSSLAINNIFYVTRKTLGSSMARQFISELIEYIHIVNVGEEEVRGALKSDIADFEDALQHAAAQTIEGLSMLVTRNTKDYKKATVVVTTPVAYLESR